MAAVTVELEQLKQVKRSLGGTVNDVVLATRAGALRGPFSAAARSRRRKGCAPRCP